MGSSKGHGCSEVSMNQCGLPYGPPSLCGGPPSQYGCLYGPQSLWDILAWTPLWSIVYSRSSTFLVCSPLWDMIPQRYLLDNEASPSRSAFPAMTLLAYIYMCLLHFSSLFFTHISLNASSCVSFYISFCSLMCLLAALMCLLAAVMAVVAAVLP